MFVYVRVFVCVGWSVWMSIVRALLACVSECVCVCVCVCRLAHVGVGRAGAPGQCVFLSVCESLCAVGLHVCVCARERQ